MRPFSIVIVAALVMCSVAAAQTGETDESDGLIPRPVPSSAADQDYQIGIEDVLSVRVWGEEELNVTARVRPDGVITVPLVNDLYVDGKSPEQVRQEITTKLHGFIKEPHVTVIVEEINSFKVYVLGEVNNQGVLTFHQPTRILQALVHAGGVTQFAKKEIVIIREEAGIEKRIKVNYKKLLEGDPSQENIFLKPGDLILVD